MVTLESLSKELPTAADLENYTAYMVAETDRGAAVMATALVEKALEDAIRSHIADPGHKITDSWFSGPNAAFQSFSSKIVLGRALGIYGPQMEATLTLIRRIRNAFAHRMIPLTFEHPALAKPCHDLRGLKDNPVEPKIAFGGACLALATVLGGHAIAREKTESKVWFP